MDTITIQASRCELVLLQMNDCEGDATKTPSSSAPHQLPSWLAGMADINPLQAYHSFSGYGRGEHPWKVSGTACKPRTKGFTAPSVQFEDDTGGFRCGGRHSFVSRGRKTAHGEPQFPSLNALFFIGLLLHVENAPNDIAQTMFTGHLIVHLDRAYPVSYITDQKG